jgi:hypothetical protein
MIKVQEKKITAAGNQYFHLHSKEYFIKTRKKFISELKETGGLSEEDLKMIEEVWGRRRPL